MRLKLATVALVLVLIPIALSLNSVGAEETRQASYSMHNFDVQVTYPLQAEPGKIVAISTRATAKSSVDVVELRIQIMHYSSGGTLVPLVAETLASKAHVRKGDVIQRDLSVSIPNDVPRGELVGFVSERVSYSMYAYYYVYNYTYGYTYYYPLPYYFYNSYESTDAGILPLTYVLSTTPEYVSLKSQYDDLNSRYNSLSNQFEQLKADHQATLDKLSEVGKLQQSTSENLEAARNTINLLSAVAVVLGIAAVGLFALYLHERRRKPETLSKTNGKVESAPTESEP